MLWRKFKLDWSYALGELVIVSLGVLIALGISEWQQEREDRELELDYAKRLKSDLRGDIVRFKDFVDIDLAAKTRVLEAFLQMEDAAPPLDHSSLDSESLYYSAYKALPESQSAAYGELTSTGNLRLIQDPALRVELEDYYDFHELMSGILAEPIGPYREILAGSMPGVAALEWRVNGVEIPEAEIAEALRVVLSHPDFQIAVNSELYYTAAMIYWLQKVRLRGEALLRNLESAYPNSD